MIPIVFTQNRWIPKIGGPGQRTPPGIFPTLNFGTGITFFRESPLFGSIGFPELIVIFVVALLVLGPRRLPEMARTLGRTLRELRRTVSDLQSSFDLEKEFETEPRASRPTAGEEKADAPAEGDAGAETKPPSGEPAQGTNEGTASPPTENTESPDGGSRPT